MVFSLDLILLCSVIFFVAALVHGSIGFGFPMISTPLLALFMDIQSAIMLTLFPTLLMNIVSIATEANFKLQSFIEAFKRNLLLACYALIGTILGTLILLQSNSEIFKVLLAFAILIYLINDHIKINLPWVIHYPKMSKFIFGISAGILCGLTNVMAPILIIHSLESKKSKRDIIQSANLCFLFGKITQIFLFTYAAKLTVNEISVSSVMFLVSAIGITFGIQISKKIKSETYIKLLKLLLLLLSAIILIQFYF